MRMIPAKCTNCGANIQVDETKEAGICEACGTAFITEKAIHNYNITNNFTIENANITVSGVDVESRITAAKKLINSGLVAEGRQMLHKITVECPEDYRAWFLIAKYAYQYNDVWFDDDTYYHKAMALADENGQNIITEHYKKMRSAIVESSKDVIDFCENVDITKLYYCYLKWYYSNTFDETEKIAICAGYGYWGFEPVNGRPTMVSYTKNDKYGYVREEIANDCKIIIKLYKKNFIGIITSKGRCVWLPQNVRNQFPIDWSDGDDVSGLDTCRIYITGFQNGKVVYNYNQTEMVYGNNFQSKSIDFDKANKGCYVATCVYGSYDCPEVWTLRRFRDNTLIATWYGRLFVRVYYAVSPTLVKWFGKTSWFKRICRGKLDKMVAKLNSNGVECTPYQDKE